MEICRKCNIVYENRICPLCNLREHDNLVHDFIESKGRSLVRELVAYLQHRETAAYSGADANGTQHTHAAIPEGDICPACEGTGQAEGPVYTLLHCTVCEGSGKRRHALERCAKPNRFLIRRLP